MPIGATDKSKTMDAIEKSVKYMQRVWKDNEFERVRHKCRNQHEDCTYWASLGECDANPKYMQLNCAPACETCDQLDIRHRCPIEPDNELIWKPGDLNTLFENIVDNADGSGEYLKFSPKALSRPKTKRDGTSAGVEKDGPWIVLLENFLTDEEADRLIEIGTKQGYERSADVGKEKPGKKSNTNACTFKLVDKSYNRELNLFIQMVHTRPWLVRLAHHITHGVKNLHVTMIHL